MNTLWRRDGRPPKTGAGRGRGGPGGFPRGWLEVREGLEGGASCETLAEAHGLSLRVVERWALRWWYARELLKQGKVAGSPGA